MAPKLSTPKKRPEPWLVFTKRGLVFASGDQHHKEGDPYVMKKTLTEEEFAKIIKCFHPDRTTQWVCMQMSCKHKKYEFCSQKHETKSMAAEDGRGQHNPMLKSIGEKGPRFHNGEAVKQWWAGWFRDARQPVMHASKKQRPKWYDGRVIMYIGVKKVWYAGREWEDHTYQVH